MSLREGDNDRLKIMSGDACKRGNGLSCYLNLQTIHWENIGQTMRRDEPTVELANFDIQDLKAPKSISPLKESVIIDQKDIEELDSNEFQLKVSP
jgi:hypothetical protein